MNNNKKTKRAIAEIEPISGHIPALLKRGRKTYWSIVKFESDQDFNKGHGLWHLHLKFDERLDPSQKKFLTTVCFVAGAEAPQELLYKGSKFELISDNLRDIKARGVVVDLEE
jgi:galactose-1-phosphate uridylyltransferase